MRMKKKDIERFEKLESKDTKQCTICKKIKPLHEFDFNPNGRKFAQPHCRICDNEKQLKRTYGISLKIYDKMLEKQGGGCMICGSKTPGGKGRFHIDHNHKNSKIRGLLCCHCNRMLGAARDNIEILAKAIIYLKGEK